MRDRSLLDLARAPQRVHDRTLFAWTIAALLAAAVYLRFGTPGIVTLAIWTGCGIVVGLWIGREDADWYVLQAQSAVRMLDAELDAKTQQADNAAAAHARRQAEREALERRAINAILADLRDSSRIVVGPPSVEPQNGRENAPQIAPRSAEGETDA